MEGKNAEHRDKIKMEKPKIHERHNRKKKVLFITDFAFLHYDHQQQQIKFRGSHEN